MAFDGIFLKHTAKELSGAYGCRVEKIHQPTKNELVFLLRSAGKHLRLLISTRPGAARIQFTSASFENPAAPPMFCMLLRKHLCGAKFVKIIQSGLDRTVFLEFEGTDEMGFATNFTLACELFGNKANIVLISKQKIIDALRRGDPETDARICLPGGAYTPPDEDKRINIFNADIGQIEDEIAQKGDLFNSFCGLSPLICREFDPARFNTVKECAAALKEAVTNPAPYLIIDGQGRITDFSYCPITQYGKDFTSKKFESFCGVLDAYYSGRDKDEILRQYRSDVQKTVQNLIARTKRKLQLRLKEKENCRNREQLRIYGELLKANINNVNPSATKAVVKNYYSENLEDVEIRINPALSIKANAAAYFKEYKKSCVAAALLDKLIDEASAELDYFCSVAECISRAETKGEIDAIKQELSQAGYYRTRTLGKKAIPAGLPKEYSFAEYHILCGKNNRQNDILTFKTAGKNDLWLHAKNIPGAHVILFCNNKEPIPAAIEFAAAVAAKNSAGAASGAVEVDYTLAKYVKKPPGAKPGMVTYDKYKSIFIKL